MTDDSTNASAQGPNDGGSDALEIRSPLLLKLLSSEVIVVDLATFVGYTIVYAYELARRPARKRRNGVKNACAVNA